MRALAALAVGVLGSLLGCSLSQPIPAKRLYTLRAERSGAPTGSCGGLLEVRRVRVAPAFERVGLVYETRDGEFVTRPYDEFAAPPGTQFRSGLLQWLRRAGLFDEVSEPGEGNRGGWILGAEIEWLYASAHNAHLSVRFILMDTIDYQAVRLLRYVESSAAESDAPRDLVAAWNVAMRAVFEQLEGDLHVFLNERGECREGDGDEASQS